MTLADFRDYVATFGIAERVYMGKLDDKQECSVGVYHSRHAYAYKTAIGGPKLQSYGTMYVTLLVHWNESPRETDIAAARLFAKLVQTREAAVNDSNIKFIQPLYGEPQDVGTDDAGIWEMVIEAAVIYDRKKEVQYE